MECAKLRATELKKEVFVCEARQNEVMGTDEEYRSVKGLMSHGEDLGQQEVCLAEEEIIDDFLSYWTSPN